METDKNGGNSSYAISKQNETVQKLLVVVTRLWHNLKVLVFELLQRFGVYDLYDRIVNASVQHPYLAVCAAVVLAGFMLPFVLIVVFALSTVVLTFSGFAILEGTLIAFISIILFGCLGAIVLASLLFGGISIAGYFGFLHTIELYRRLTNTFKTHIGVKRH